MVNSFTVGWGEGMVAAVELLAQKTADCPMKKNACA